MEPMEYLIVLSRWLHVGAAIVLLGGSAFMRYVLMPGADGSLSPEEHSRLREAVLARWRKLNGLGIGLLLLSGFYNYFRVILEQEHKGDGLYHGLMGTKMILAFVVFFFASVLAGRSPKFEGMRASRKKWMTVTILLAAIVVAIGGFLKVRGIPEGLPGKTQKPAAVSAE